MEAVTLRRRTFITGSGLGLAGLVLAACSGGNDANPGSGTTSPAGTGNETAGNSNGGSAGGGGRLTVLTPEFAGTTGQETFEGQILADFGDNYEFSVDYTDWGRLNEKLSAGVAGGVVADLLMLGVGWVEPFAHKGILAELPTSLTEGKGIDEALLRTARYEGALFAVPYFVDGRILTYHRDMFEAAGISEDDLPTTLEDFREMLKEVKPDDGVGIDLFSQNLRQVWAHLIGAYGGSMFDADGNITFTDGTGEAALQYMLDLVADGTASFELQAAEGQPRPWQQKRAAIDMVNSSAWPGLTRETPELLSEEAMGMMLLPRSGGGDPVMFQGGTLLAVSTNADDPAAVQELIEHMMQPDKLLAAVEEVGKVPSRADLEDPIIDDNRMLTYITENFEYATAFEGGSPAWMELRGAVAGEIEAAVIGQKTAAEAVEALAALAEDAQTRI